nr:immunoglobulin light chain junction region [Mus musculus]NSM00164.1 immunoglobulin light chain junction region [Mus musculus]NSM01063.1 immunoglobulin light chain junction region [Mus musculus]NSM02626.1 immunoglobulin light chain junction region [Mus musculus]
CGQSYSYPHTF